MIIDSYSRVVYNMALNFIGNKDDASDITQDIFVKIYTNIDKFKEDKSFSSWVLKISRNYCIDYWRKKKKFKAEVELDESITGTSYTPEDSAICQSETVFLRERINLLPPDLRMFLIMRDIQGYTYEEISDHFDVPLGTVKSRINRARVKLTQLVINEGQRHEM